MKTINSDIRSNNNYIPKLLHGIAEYSLLSKQGLESGLQFKDLLSGMLNIDDFGVDDDDDDYGGYYEKG